MAQPWQAHVIPPNVWSSKRPLDGALGAHLAPVKQPRILPQPSQSHQQAREQLLSQQQQQQSVMPSLIPTPWAQQQQQQQQQQKSIVQGEPTTMPNQPAAASQHQSQAQIGQEKETYVVAASGTDNEVVVRTLMGDYTENGVNHGRKVFQKMLHLPGREVVTVLLYYWDSRDSPDFEGWWFGNKIGGTQVWAHCKASSLQPPRSGWKVPWNGAVRADLTVVNKQEHLHRDSTERLQHLTEELHRIDGEVSQSLEQAAAIVGIGEKPVEVLAEASLVLGRPIPSVENFVKRVADGHALAVGDTVPVFKNLSHRARFLQDTLMKRYGDVSTAKQSAEQAIQQRLQHKKDEQTSAELVAAATEKTNAAEDLVEKTIITSEMVEAVGEDGEVVQSAIDQVEQVAKLAQSAIGEARIFLNLKLASIRKSGSHTKETTQVELNKLLQQLGAAQEKLAPLKHARREMEHRLEAQKIQAEVSEKLALAELDLDQTEEMVVLLTAEDPTKEHLLQAHRQVVLAEQNINQAVQMFENKKHRASGLSSEFLALGARGVATRVRIKRLRDSLKLAGERATVEGYVAEATDKFLKVIESSDRLEEMEGRWKEGAEITEEIIASSEATAESVQTAAGVARMFIQMKTLELKRLAGTADAEPLERLQDYQRQVEAMVRRVVEFKALISKRKGTVLVRDLAGQVAKCEEFVGSMRKAASVFADDGNLERLSAEEIRVASEATLRAEAASNESLHDARKRVTARQIESKGKDFSPAMGAELMKLQTRLASATAEVARQRKLFSSVEHRIAARRIADDAESQLEVAEGKLELLDAAFAKLAEVHLESVSGVIDEVDAAAHTAQTALESLTEFFESQARHAKEGLGKLQPRLRRSQAKLSAELESKRDRIEAVSVRSMLQEGRDKVSRCEAALEQASVAEKPFGNGAEAKLSLAKVDSFILDFEKAIQVVQSRTTEAKTYVSMKRLASKALCVTNSRIVSEALVVMQATVDTATKRLSDTRSRCVEIKKAAMRRKAGIQA